MNTVDGRECMGTNEDERDQETKRS